MQNTSTPASERTHDEGTLNQIVDRLGPEPLALAIWAHPDDESFLAGGLISAITNRGGRVVNVTATSGEHGTPDPEVDLPSVLGPRRVRELEAALQDAGRRLPDPSRIRRRRVRPHTGSNRRPDRGSVIDQVDPDLVITFGRDGVTAHPDHRSIGRWTRRAIYRRGDRIPLLTTSVGAAWPAPCVERLHTVNAFWPGYPHRTVSRFDVVVDLGEELVDRKLDALACHESQMGPVAGALGPDGYRLLASIEAYRAGNRTALELLARPSISHCGPNRLEHAMS